MKQKDKTVLEPVFKVTAKAPKYDVEEAQRNHDLLLQKQNDHKLNLKAKFKRDFKPKSAKKRVQNVMSGKALIESIVKHPLQYHKLQEEF